MQCIEDDEPAQRNEHDGCANKSRTTALQNNAHLSGDRDLVARAQHITYRNTFTNSILKCIVFILQNTLINDRPLNRTTYIQYNVEYLTQLPLHSIN